MVAEDPAKVAQQAIAQMPSGDTRIHRHRDAEEIHGALALYVLGRGSPASDTPTWDEMVEMLNEEFPDLNIGSKQYLMWYAKRYVVPSLYVVPAFVRQGIFEAQADLNTALAKLEIAQEGRNELRAIMMNDEVSATEKASMMRATLAAYDAAEDSLERWGIIPGKKTTTVNIDAQVDMNQVYHDLAPPPTEVVDVTPSSPRSRDKE